MRGDLRRLASDPPTGTGSVSGLMWSPFVEITAGGCGIIFALWSIGRRRAGKPMDPGAKKADVGLLIFGVLLLLVGAVRMLEL